MHPPLVRMARGAAVLGGAAATTLAASSAVAPPARAAAAIPRLPTQTMLSASAPSVSSGGSVTITATIRPGVLVTAPSSVTFTDATSSATLGTAKPTSRCLLVFKPCAVTINVPASELVNGANAIKGSYSGDIVEAPSAGSTVVTATLTSPPTLTSCGASLSGYCDTGEVDSPDGTTSADISSQAPTSGSETISVSFATAPLSCSTSPLQGDVLVFSATNAGSYKRVFYAVFGAAADTLNADYPTGGHLCYESPTSFTTASGTAATIDPSTGLYAGLLPACILSGEGTPASNEPCLDDAGFFPGDDPSGDEYYDNFETNAADPRASN